LTGNGFGLMASKVARLNLILHDRSRLRDIEVLLASDNFASNKMRIEFGWSHPEGGPTSDNVIGKYLNALKDGSIYQVRSVDYSFGSGNTVSINIKLSCSGFSEGKSTSAAAGSQVPLSTVSDYIDRAIESFIKRETSDGKELAPQLHSSLKITQRTAKSPLSLMSWDTVQRFYSSLKARNKKNRI
jgi:hypothetical protein